MNRLLVPYFAFSAAIVCLAGCDPEVQQRQSAPPHHGGGFTGEHHRTVEQPIDEPVTTEPRETEHTVRHEEPESTPPKEPAHNAPAPAVGNYEYGKGVPGK